MLVVPSGRDAGGTGLEPDWLTRRDAGVAVGYREDASALGCGENRVALERRAKRGNVFRVDGGEDCVLDFFTEVVLSGVLGELDVHAVRPEGLEDACADVDVENARVAAGKRLGDVGVGEKVANALIVRYVASPIERRGRALGPDPRFHAVPEAREKLLRELAPRILDDGGPNALVGDGPESEQNERGEGEEGQKPVQRAHLGRCKKGDGENRHEKRSNVG